MLFFNNLFRSLPLISNTNLFNIDNPTFFDQQNSDIDSTNYSHLSLEGMTKTSSNSHSSLNKSSSPFNFTVIGNCNLKFENISKSLYNWLKSSKFILSPQGIYFNSYSIQIHSNPLVYKLSHELYITHFLYHEDHNFDSSSKNFIHSISNYRLKFKGKIFISISWSSPFLLDKHIHFCHSLIENGCDIIYCFGFQNIYPIQIYKQKPIIYSLGTFNIPSNDIYLTSAFRIQFSPSDFKHIIWLPLLYKNNIISQTNNINHIYNIRYTFFRF